MQRMKAINFKKTLPHLLFCFLMGISTQEVMGAWETEKTGSSNSTIGPTVDAYTHSYAPLQVSKEENSNERRGGFKNDRTHSPIRPLQPLQSLQPLSISPTETGAKPDINFKFPSLKFLSQISPWRLQIGNVTLLEDNLASLRRLESDCERIDEPTSAHYRQKPFQGRIVCSNRQGKFLAESSDVVLNFATTNEVLTGISLPFKSATRAKQLMHRLLENLESRGIPYFQEISADPDNERFDSPFLSFAVIRGQNVWILKVQAHHVEKFEEMEVVAQSKWKNFDFGELVLGKSVLSDLPSVPEIAETDEVCQDVSSLENPFVREFYGRCFGFPFEAHMQLNFNPQTSILETAILSPIGVVTGASVDEMLTKRFGNAHFCQKVQTDLELQAIRSERQRVGQKNRTEKVNEQRASLFLGTCENPIVYDVRMRFVFENRQFSEKTLMADFEARKRTNAWQGKGSDFQEDRLQAIKPFFSKEQK